MMAPDEEPDKGYRTESPTHASSIEEREGTVILQYVTDKREHWEYENIHLRVPEESEHMLVKNGVPASCHIKELRVSIPIKQDAR
jgi:hypothetical protein